jgi:hypothetical protein
LNSNLPHPTVAVPRVESFEAVKQKSGVNYIIFRTMEKNPKHMNIVQPKHQLLCVELLADEYKKGFPFVLNGVLVFSSCM